MDKAPLMKLTVTKLRELAKEIPDAKGLSGMKKDELIALLESHGLGGATETATAARPADKSEIKRRIRELKAQKRDALAQQDRELVKECNRRIHHYKRVLRKLVRASAG